MARIPVKLREKSAPEEEAMSQANIADATIQKKPEAEVIFSQERKPELGRYWLQVDRQTKRSFDTPAEAEAAGLLIKSAFYSGETPSAQKPPHCLAGVDGFAPAHSGSNRVSARRFMNLGMAQRQIEFHKLFMCIFRQFNLFSSFGGHQFQQGYV